MSKLEEAKTALDQLIEAARTGAIIPVRLPGQLEDVQNLLNEAEEEHKAARNQEPVSESVEETAEFWKTAIHELRTPMTSIRGYSDMLSNPAMSGEMNDMQSQLLQVVRANSRRMESLLSDMSYINKIRSGLLIVNEKMDMFKNVAQLSEKEARPVAEELNRTLEYDIPQGLPLLNTDGEHFAHAMFKIIENGLRYSSEGDGKVVVTGQADGSNLVVTIEDNGIGMTEDEIAKLGTLYFRADHDMVRNHKGSGLGIPIAYGLIRALNGDIAVQSTPDQGTCFTITLKGMT